MGLVRATNDSRVRYRPACRELCICPQRRHCSISLPWLTRPLVAPPAPPPAWWWRWRTVVSAASRRSARGWLRAFEETDLLLLVEDMVGSSAELLAECLWSLVGWVWGEGERGREREERIKEPFRVQLWRSP